MNGRRRGPRPGRLPPILTSIRVRLTLWYVAILTVVLLVFGGLVYGAQARTINADTRDHLRGLSQELAATYNPTDGHIHPNLNIEGNGKSVSAAVQGGGPLEPTPMDKGLTFVGKATLVLLLDRDGRIVQRLGRAIDESITLLVLKQALLATTGKDSYISATLPDVPTGEAERQYLLYSTPLLFKNTSVGILVIAQPDDTAAELRQLRLTLLLAAPATLLIAAGGGYWLATRAMRPVRLISRAAGEIEASDLSRRLRLPGRDELGELAATFDHMLDRLEAAFTRQRQFTADASHELRTPLTIVDLEVTRALASRRTPEEYARALAIIQTENARMARLVGDLLVLARADAGRAILQRDGLDLSDLALEVVERLAPLARQRGVTLTTGTLPELPIAGDRVYLTQLLTNLVENGIIYTSGHGMRVCIETGQCRTADHAAAWVRVVDDGPGIAAEHLPQLFDRFYRVDHARSRDEGAVGIIAGSPGGSGLGLAIVRWVAEAHGGEVGVRSTPGQGTTFEVRLPLAGP
jgi:signal transduction histidine kinase